MERMRTCAAMVRVACVCMCGRSVQSDRTLARAQLASQVIIQIYSKIEGANNVGQCQRRGRTDSGLVWSHWEEEEECGSCNFD
jgi:hypothetical protein